MQKNTLYELSKPFPVLRERFLCLKDIVLGFQPVVLVASTRGLTLFFIL